MRKHYVLLLSIPYTVSDNLRKPLVLMLLNLHELIRNINDKWRRSVIFVFRVPGD